MITDIQSTIAKTKETLESIRVLRDIRVQAISKYKIEIPAPGRKPKYPWTKLKVHQSFLVPCAPNQVCRQRVMNSVTSCICNVRKKTGMNFVQRSDPHGVRVWRVA